MFYRSLSFFLFVLMALLPGSVAWGANLGEASGLLLVGEDTDLRLNGKPIGLWGVDLMAGDQQCWRDNKAWDCGVQANMALLHFIDDQNVECHTKAMRDTQTVMQCFIGKDGKKLDIAAYMVAHGWAMDNESESQGLYEDEEDAARESRLGIWTSRFQTPADWKAGVEHYVEYDKVAAPKMAPADPNAQMIVGPAEYVVEPAGNK